MIGDGKNDERESIIVIYDSRLKLTWKASSNKAFLCKKSLMMMIQNHLVSFFNTKAR